MMPRTNLGIVIFSGGSAANNLVDHFNAISISKNCPVTYSVPISDNGGSSSELIRVFDGPSVGDLRSIAYSALSYYLELITLSSLTVFGTLIFATLQETITLRVVYRSTRSSYTLTSFHSREICTESSFQSSAVFVC